MCNISSYRLNEDLMVKVSDFGLAKKLDQIDYVTHEQSKELPIRWMSMEATEKRIFTIKSDVVFLPLFLFVHAHDCLIARI